MNVLQSRMHKLLVEFDGICRENGIEYCVCSGCALGIERHGGFIPWDDDIDLFITRDNYIKLDELMNKNLPENRAWVTDRNYPEYENPLVRYVDTSTTLIARSRIDDGTPLGIFLELFILDPYPDDKEKQKEYNKYLWLFGELKATRYCAARATGYKDTYDEQLYRMYEKRLEHEDKAAVLDEIQKEHLTYNYDECSWLCARWPILTVVLKKEWMENLEYRDFEGAMLPFMKDNLDYLYYTEYGYDWDLIPQKENRETHDTITNIDKSFDVQLDAVLKRAGETSFVEKIKKNKIDRLEMKFHDMAVQETAAYQKKAYLEALAAELVKEDLTTSFENLPNLRVLLSRYLKVQCSRRYYITKMKANIPEELLEAILYLMIFSNKMTMIDKIIEIYSDYKCSSRYKELSDAICQMKLNRYKNKRKEVQEAYNYLCEAGFGKIIECERSCMWLMSRDYQTVSESEILSKYSELEKKNDSVIKKHIGDYYYNNNNIREADVWYTKAKKTRNGMILFDMYKKGFF